MVPWSPDPATKVTPGWPAGVVKNESREVSMEYSGRPKLIDTTDTPGWSAAHCTAEKRLDSPASLASTSRIVAPGAIACAHSTSRDSSSSQPPEGSTEGERPLTVSLATVSVGSGRPKRASNA